VRALDACMAHWPLRKVADSSNSTPSASESQVWGILSEEREVRARSGQRTYSSWLNQVELWFAASNARWSPAGLSPRQRLARKLHALHPSSQPTCRAHQMAYRDFSHRIIATFIQLLQATSCRLNSELKLRCRAMGYPPIRALARSNPTGVAGQF